MERRFTQLSGTAVRGTDDEVGQVRDIYFDDASWRARYFVVETGGWLDRRRVLLSPNAIVPGVWTDCLPVRLTREQVRGSPDVDTRKPISRQHEEALNAHYGWPAYWSATAGGGALGLMAAPIVAVAGPVAMPAAPAPEMPRRAAGDPHLRSADEVRGYKIAASDGDIGHVEDFIFDEAQWEIRYLIIDTRNWLPGRKVLVSPQWIQRVSWTDRAVHVDLRRDSVKASPEYDPEHSVAPDYDERLRAHYGRGAKV